MQVDKEIYSFLYGGKGTKTLVFIHGNLSSSEIWSHILMDIISDYKIIAPDLCGFGETSCKGIDASRGFSVFTEEIILILKRLGVGKVSLIGHSMGGGVVYDMIAKHPDIVESAVLVDPMSPYGWGGIKGLEGEPCYPDFSGSGGGLIKVYNPFFLQILDKLKSGGSLTQEEKQLLDATINLYFAPGYTPPVEIYNGIIEMIRKAQVGDDFYPGDYTNSPNWPYVAPGTKGVLNAMSPKFFNARPMLNVKYKPSILWIHGSQDLMVSDSSPIDIGLLGKNGFIPNYPGEEVFPPQPMFSQVKAFLERYSDLGGSVETRIIEGAGHTPFIEKKDVFIKYLLDFLA